MAREAAVLDIGSSKITVAIGGRGVNNTFNIRGWGECNYDGFEDGEFHDAGQLRDVFAHAVEMAEQNAQLKINKLYVGVPGDFTDCYVREVSISLDRKRRITARDIQDLYRHGKHVFDREMMTDIVISCDPIYFMLDDNRRIISPIGQTSTKLTGKISYLSCANNFLQLITGITRDIDIPEIEFIPACLAEVTYLFEPEKRDAHVLLIDVGYLTANVILARGDGILGLKTIDIGGGHITAALYTMFECPEYAIAEALKRKIVLTLDTAENDFYEVSYKSNTYKYNAKAANDIVRECIDEMGSLLRKAINKFDYNYPEHIKFHLTGGGISYMRGARDLLSRSLNKAIEIIEPAIPLLDKPHLSSVLGVMNSALVFNDKETSKAGVFGKIRQALSGRKK